MVKGSIAILFPIYGIIKITTRTGQRKIGDTSGRETNTTASSQVMAEFCAVCHGGKSQFG